MTASWVVEGGLLSARMQFCGRFPGLRAVSCIWSGAAADSLSLGSKRSGRVRLQKTQPKRRRFETVCRSLQKDAGRSLLRSIAPGWTGLCGRKVCSRAWCPAPRMRRKARSGSRDKASFWQMRSFFQTVWFVKTSRSPVGRMLGVSDIFLYAGWLCPTGIA